ncbi:MAG: hypothetical protein HY774_06960 [Acidobacteria bacterium]|nr:hypothetical protein [Acidobacteriota bacterium]
MSNKTDMMEVYYPNSVWLNLRRDIFDDLDCFKIRPGIPTWEAGMERLLAEKGGKMVVDLELVEKIAAAVLYEGYMLYPYRPSAVKNRKRFNFGVLTPRAYSEAQHGTERWTMHTEYLIWCEADAVLNVKVRFLNLRDRRVFKTESPPVAGDGQENLEFLQVDHLEIAGQHWYAWQEAVEREIAEFHLNPKDLVFHPKTVAVTFLPETDTQMLMGDDGQVHGKLEHELPSTSLRLEIKARVESIQEFPDGQVRTLKKISVRIENQTGLNEGWLKHREEVLTRSMISTHTILGVHNAEFVSLLDPPETLRSQVAGCQNNGAWPVLVGTPGKCDVMLASPIILYDYPQVAPESLGDFYDGTEIDEMLALRVMTLTDAEKQEMRNVDDRARRILERTETLPEEHFMKLHGALRGLRPLEP